MITIKMISIKIVKERLTGNKLYKDSFWAVFGNGTGNALLLLSGIIIARLLGKDLYGEYGVVKTTMFHIAAFSTFGLGYTSTRYISQYTKENPSCLRAITKSSLKISFLSSFGLSIILIIFAEQLAAFVNHPPLAMPFRFLGVIIICRALSTTCSGIISGHKNFKQQSINNVTSGVVMIILAPTLTFFYGLNGSLAALLCSQLSLALLNLKLIYDINKNLLSGNGRKFTKELFNFSIPVAMQEFTYTLSTWGGTLLLAKYASLGEVGIYTAALQWNAIITFIPGLLSNVVLSYLSGTQGAEHYNMMKKVLVINLTCISIPLIIVLICSSFIVSFYGETFIGMRSVLNICVFGSAISVVTRVFQNDLISQGKNWLLFAARSSRDILYLLSLFFILQFTKGINAANNCAILGIVIGILFLTTIYLMSRIKKQQVST